jgi:hypothetical protein
MGVVFVCLQKTERQICLLVLITVQKALGYVDNDALIGGIIVQDGAVHFACRNKDNVVRAQLIGTSLNLIVDIPALEVQYFVKIVEMEIDRFHVFIEQMKNAKICIQIAGFFIVRHYVGAPSRKKCIACGVSSIL